MTGLGGFAGMLVVFGAWVTVSGMRCTNRVAWAGPAWRDRCARIAANRRLGIAVAVGVLVLVLTRWPVAAILAGVFAYAAPMLLGLTRTDTLAQAKLDALASWVDTIRGEIRSYAGVEQAIRATTGMTKTPVADHVDRLATALDSGVRLRIALAAFRRDVDHPAADLVGISLVKAATCHAGNVADQLDWIAQSLRDDIAARERIQTSQTEARTSARLVVLIVATVGVGLYLFNRAMLPLGNLQGQLVLALVSAVWIAAGMWLHRLATTPPPRRVFKTADEDIP